MLANINGHPITHLRLTVSARGPWVADCTLDNAAPDVTGRVTIKLEGLELVGTVTDGGAYLGAKTVRIVAGGGSWARALPPKGYHNDAGIKALNVAQDAAREAGEVLGSFAPEHARIGVDYARQAGPASRTLKNVIGSAAWWVDYAGVTHVGARSSAPIAEDAYEVLEANPRSKRVVLGVQDLSSVVIGSVLSKGLDGPHTVRDLEIELAAERIRVVAWCGPASGSSRLASLLQAVIEQSTDKPLHGLWEYRVVAMSGERVDLQAVDKSAGLPDLAQVSMWPGVAGVHAELAPGAEVLVQFIEGDRTRPVVTLFGGNGTPGWLPDTLTLGGTSGPPIAREGDTVEVLLPPAIFTGTINGVPSPPVPVFTGTKIVGMIVGGSFKVRCA